MSINNYAFIVKAPDYHPTKQRTILESELFRSEIIGVNSIDDAINVARELISRGVQLIELCGGFGEEGAAKVIEALGSETPIGFVSFSVQESEKLAILKGGG